MAKKKAKATRGDKLSTVFATCLSMEARLLALEKQVLQQKKSAAKTDRLTVVEARLKEPLAELNRDADTLHARLMQPSPMLPIATVAQLESRIAALEKANRVKSLDAEEKVEDGHAEAKGEKPYKVSLDVSDAVGVAIPDTAGIGIPAEVALPPIPEKKE